MIIKSPYAFLIKNFRKVHVALLLLGIYIYYKTMQIHSFVNEFLKLGTYDLYSEPISKYVSFLLIIAVIAVIITYVLMLRLLKKKNKPWKTYLVPIIDYVLLLVGFLFVYNYFKSYNGDFNLANVRAMRDIFFVGTLPQYIIFIILGIRIIGIDLKKFEFKQDEEFLQLEDKDKQEFEFSINIDKHSFIRIYRRLLRNLGYFYKEHQKIINAFGIAILVILFYRGVKLVFVTHRVYRQGQDIGSSGYTIKINDAYFTNRDYKGKIIEKNYNFVVLDVSITNHSQRRKINFNRFHIMNGVSNYSPTSKLYGSYFKDLGTAYDDKTISRDETFNTLLIYKVDKKLKRYRFVLYYQEFVSRTETYLRKIKLKLKDLSKIKDVTKTTLGKEFDIVIDGEEEEITFDNLEILDNVDYKQNKCNSTDCSVDDVYYNVKDGYKILKLDFESNGIDGKEMIDFLSKYGKINYIDNKDEEKAVDISNAVDRSYLGKYVYILMPENISKSKKCQMIITVRNNRYTINLK